jgi:hypothetical protein
MHAEEYPQNKRIEELYGTKVREAKLSYVQVKDIEVFTDEIRELNPISVQVVCEIYMFEKNSDLHQNLTIDKEDYVVLPFVQKEDAEKFNRFCEWWLKEVTPNIPSEFFLHLLTAIFLNMHYYGK